MQIEISGHGSFQFTILILPFSIDHPVSLFSIDPHPMLSVSPTYLLYYIPLLIAISMVFGATRHEDTGLILKHAWETARWITLFMVIIFAVLLAVDWFI